MKNWNDVLTYKNGNLYWRERTANCVQIGARAGSNAGRGYRHVKYKKQTHMEHRVVWEMHFGEIPNGLHIDHINRNRSDNRIENLRLATPYQNRQNAPSGKSAPTSEHKGVFWSTARGKWVAALSVRGKQKCLGGFDDEGDAALAYNSAAQSAWGEFAYLNEVRL